MKKKLFPYALLILVSVFLAGCASKGEGPVKTEAVNLSKIRKQVESSVQDEAVQARLLGLTTTLEQQVQQLNDFDANGLSRVALMSADYGTTDTALLKANQSFRIRRKPLQSRIADTLFAMKAAAPPSVWPTLGRVAFDDTINNMVIKKIQPES